MSRTGRLAVMLLLILSASMASARDAPAVDRIKRKSTTGAVLRSLVVPGWGQLYNESYYKAAAFALIEGIQISGIYGLHNKMQAAKRVNYFPEQYAAGSVERSAAESGNRKADADAMRYRERRNKTLWWFAGTVLLSLGDAYVDAQLYGIDVSPNLSFNPELTAGLTASISF
jgi:hypothetical protein